MPLSRKLKLAARTALAPYEGMRWEGIPLRPRLLFCAAFPSRAWRVFREWFRQVTALPGDHFWEIARDVELQVVNVKPRSVKVEVRTGQLIAAGVTWDTPMPPNVVRYYETRPRKPLGWWL